MQISESLRTWPEEAALRRAWLLFAVGVAGWLAILGLLFPSHHAALAAPIMVGNHARPAACEGLMTRSGIDSPMANFLIEQCGTRKAS